MRDVVFLAIATGFFGLCVAFVALCDRVIGPDATENGEVYD
jgi:hypothetical protein